MSFQHKVLLWCRDHLKHDFQALIDSTDTQRKRLGQDLMRDTKRLFTEYAKCRDGTITHETLKRNLRPVRQRVESLLLRGFGTAAHGMCRPLYEHRAHLWTFLEDPNVTPTNNSSERGDRFVEIILTVIETWPQRKHSAAKFLRNTIETQMPESLLGM